MVRSSSSGQQHHGGNRGESDDGGEASTCSTTPDTIAPRRQASPSNVDASAVAGAGKSPREGVRVASPRPSAASSSSRKSRRGKRAAASRSPSPLPDRSCRGSGVSRANGVNGDATTTTGTRSRRAMTPPPNGTVRSPKGGKSPRLSPKKSTPAAPHLKVSVPVPTPSSVGGRAGAGPFVLPRSGGRRGGLVRRTHSPKTVVSPFLVILFSFFFSISRWVQLFPLEG